MGQKVLLALDDTDASQNMFQWFLAHDLQPDTEVHLLHIILGSDEQQHSYLPHADYFEQALPREHHRVVLEMLTRRYLTALAQAGNRPVIHLVHASLDPKTVARIICSKAAELKADRCYVAGTKSAPRGLLSKLFCGQSTTDYCKAQCVVPLTVV